MQAFSRRAKAGCIYSYCWNHHLCCYDGRRLGRVKIVTLRAGARAKERKGEGEGEGRKNTPAGHHCSFGKLRTLSNGAPDWCCIGKVHWCLSVKSKSILCIPFSFAHNCGKEVFWIQKWRTRETNFNSAVETSLLELEWLECRVYYAIESQSDFCTAIRARFACSAETVHHIYLMKKCYLFQ